jgi:NTP pyrophosphatase (non-canonical NTP hydrolase)
MDFNEYQNLCLITANFTGNPREITSNMCMGLCGEAGEVTDYVKKCLYHAHEYNSNIMREELGDLLWYFVVLADRSGITLDSIMEENIKKLKKRYPEGKFTYEDSLARKDKDI